MAELLRMIAETEDDLRRSQAATSPPGSVLVQLTSGGPVTVDHRELKESGQQKGYVVLAPVERAKGYV